MADEQGNTAGSDQQAALATERERSAKLEKQVSDKQAMIDRQATEIGKVRELERRIEELDKGKDDAQIKTLTDKIAELEAKIVEGAKKPDASEQASGTNPPPTEDRKRDDALAALKETFAKLTDEQRAAVEQKAVELAEAQGADITDVEQRAVLVEHAVRGLGITAAAKKVSIWDGIAPEQPKVSAAERLRQALSGEGERQPPRTTGSAFGPESGRKQGSTSEQSHGERPFLGMAEELDRIRQRIKKE